MPTPDFDDLVLVGTDDNSGVGDFSFLTVPVVEGQTYWIQVDGATSGDEGQFTLRWMFYIDATISSIPATATASVTAPVITYRITSVAATSSASASSPVPTIQITSVISAATASIANPQAGTGYITPTTADATAANSSPSVTIQVTSNIAAATASVGATGVFIVSTGAFSFPEETEYPLWAGNLEGQKFDDAMPL